MPTLHAIVTGGSSGIGRALAHKLAAGGYNLSLIARREAQLNEAAAEMYRHFTQPDQRAAVFPADVSDKAQAEAAVAKAIETFGAPDLLVTSAGVAVPGYFSEIATDAFERSMAVNYFGTLYVVRAALPAMQARRRGRIVFISSGAGLMGLYGYSTYCPSKFAVRGLAEGLRAELREHNIDVSVVYPPDTETPMLEEENKIKPEETKLITGVAATWKPEAVARAIMRGVNRGAFAITPGAVITMMNRIPGIAVPALNWYADLLVRRVQRQRASAAEGAQVQLG
ncbi:MAG TPA: SDR family oxidoreductase [Stellaceae bacterium]|nr:SDR family oxidoreductase [Stellaceae bacterium]